MATLPASRGPTLNGSLHACSRDPPAVHASGPATELRSPPLTPRSVHAAVAEIARASCCRSRWRVRAKDAAPPGQARQTRAPRGMCRAGRGATGRSCHSCRPLC
eukprot:5701692-Prymnesium_polylepis.1